MNYWRGKIAVVTGASSGIGAAIALNLAEHGVNVVGLARRVNLIEELSKKSKGPKIEAIQCDVSHKDSLENAFQKIKKNHGRVDIMVNNAGRSHIGTTLDTEMSHEEILKTINTNLLGAVIGTREAFKLMRRHNDNAYIININSVLGHQSPLLSMTTANVYGATKQALRHHTDTIRLDLAHSPDSHRIRVASVVPGSVRTNIIEAAGCPPEEIEAAWNMFAYLKPEDVANAVQYILSSPSNVNIAEMKIKATGEKF